MKKKVAIIDNSIGKTGAIMAILNFTEYAKDEYEFIYILPSDSGVVKLVNFKGYEVLQLPFIELSKSYKNIILYLPCLSLNAWRFSRIVKKHNIHLVHSNDFYNLVAPLAKFLGAKCKLITHVRFMPNRFPKILKSIWLRFHFKYSEKIICVSNAVKFNLPQNRKVQTIYDGLPEEINERVILNDKPIVKMLYLAHFILGKGQNFALEAFELAFKKNQNLRLEFAGGDLGLHKNKEYRKRLEKTTRDKGLMEVITFTGEIENTSEKMNEADIFLNFSESESFSMTTLEALSLGVPTIASDSGGPAELFEDDQSGQLVPNRNVEEMAKAILKLASDFDLRTKFSNNSVKFVQEKFSAPKTLEKLKNLYKKVMNNEN